MATTWSPVIVDVVPVKEPETLEDFVRQAVEIGPAQRESGDPVKFAALVGKIVAGREWDAVNAALAGKPADVPPQWSVLQDDVGQGAYDHGLMLFAGYGDQASEMAEIYADWVALAANDAVERCARGVANPPPAVVLQVIRPRCNAPAGAAFNPFHGAELRRERAKERAEYEQRRRRALYPV